MGHRVGHRVGPQLGDRIADALYAALGIDERPPDLERAIVDRVQEGVRAVADIDPRLDPLAVATTLGTTLSKWRADGRVADDLPRALAELPVGELALATACARGNARAITRFETLHFVAIPAALRRIGLEDAGHADVLSVVREKLFVGTAQRPPRILELAGHGDLTALVRIVAVRTALNLRRKRRPELDDSDDALAQAVAAQTDPELGALKSSHKQAFKRAFEAAIAELEPEGRNLLRLTLLHGLTIDEVAGIHRVHRSTAARRIAKVRDTLGTNVRHELRRRLGADRAELESLFRVVQSSLDVSFERLLLPTG